ncbi:MAG: CDP-alcohol phosphatidyltransferase family protein [Halobacteriota archaeon]|nr:CDP-alcohol phosphatidyltransferase family protein [Halobacteriota archaeon]
MDTANILTSIRLFLAPVSFFAILMLDWQIAVCILVFAGATDLLDGYFARRRTQDIRWGKFFDSITDKIFMGLIILALFIKYQLSFSSVLLFMSRDILTLGLFLVALLVLSPSVRKRMSFSPNKYGKMTTGFQALTVLLIIFDNNFQSVTLFTTFLLGVGSIVDRWLSLTSVIR